MGNNLTAGTRVYIIDIIGVLIFSVILHSLEKSLKERAN